MIWRAGIRGDGGESVFREIFAAYPDALLLVDSSGVVVLANPAAATLLGYTVADLQGLPVDALVPDDIRPRHAAFRGAYSHNPQPRPMGTHMDLVARRNDGTEVMVEIALSPLQDSGEGYVVAAIRGIGAYPRVRQALKRARYAECMAQFSRVAVDTREPRQLLREAPAAAAAALETDAAVLFLLEPDGQNFRVAGGIELAAGEAEGTLVPNRPDTPPGYVLAQGRAVVVSDYASESRFTVPPEYLRHGWVCALSVPLLERGHAVAALTVRSRQPQSFGEDEIRFLESLANIVATTLQRAQSEEALRHAQRLESVGQLTGGIAHDFNNLLTVILGNLQVLDDRVAADDEARQSVESAARAARRGAELTAKLLAFSRRLMLHPTRVDVSSLLHSLAEMLRRTLDQRIVIEIDAPADCPPCLADAGQLESALLNIAINGRDAMPQGGKLSFRARGGKALPAALSLEAAAEGSAAPADAAFVMIALSDTGSGMSEAVRARAFEPFFTTKQAGRGTGLGLSTVHGFAAQSRGGVTLDSTPGNGTTVTLYIPQAQGSEGAASPKPLASVGLPAGLRVLLVEDEPEVLQVTQSFLAGWGCIATPCRSGEQALHELQGQVSGFDVLLSDVALGPAMRGTELARHARALRPDLAVLLMSGYSSELLAGERAELDGSNDLLRKPFSREDLGRALGAVIARSRPPAAGRPG